MTGFSPYARRHLWQWAVSFFSALLAARCTVFIPRVIGSAIDELGGPKPQGGHLLRYAAEIIAAALGSAVLYLVMRWVAGTASREISYEVRRDIFARLTVLDAGYFQRVRTGDLMNRLTGDLSAVQEMLGFGLNQLINTLFILTLTLAMMLELSTPLGLRVLAVFPLIIILLVVMMRITAKRYARVQEEQSRIAARAQENFSGVRVVKGYAVEDRELRDYTRLNAAYRRKVLELARVEGMVWASVGLMMNGVFVLVLWTGTRGLGRGGSFGGLSLGAFVSFTTYLFQLSWPMLSIGVIANIFQRGRVSWKRLHEVLAAPTAIADGPQTDARITSLKGEVRFEHVTLVLGGRTLLEDISLTVPVGTTLGVTGRTGAGKTLLMSLLTRLLEPTSGRVLVDGYPLPTIPLEVLRRSFGVVPQEPFLFSDTLAENIAFGLVASTEPTGEAKPDLERVQWAADVAGLSSDIEGFPLRYETLIGERGVTLSGGQRQRTALARAVARRPPLLVLDDAMSAVDTETEARILTGLKSVLGERTVFLLGHRVSTLRHADHIVVLDAGRILEQGSHAGLLQQNGHYADLDRRQQLQRELERAV